MKKVVFALAVAVGLSGFDAIAFEYNVTRPAICPRWSGAEAGEWTMDLDVALAKYRANADSKLLVLVSGSLWCPDCVMTDAHLLDRAEFDATLFPAFQADCLVTRGPDAETVILERAP